MTWTKEELGKLREHQTSMLTVSEIAEKMQKDKREVQQELEAMGYRPRYEKEKPEPSEFLKPKDEAQKKERAFRVSDEEKATIFSLREAGKTFRQIAIQTGIKEPTVKTIVRKERLKEKEPASAATDTSSVTKEVNSLSQDNDTTETPECQAISGITALGILESALLNAFGDRAEVTRIFAERQIAELFFVYGGQEYGFTFGVKEGVPDYGNDKH